MQIAVGRTIRILIAAAIGGGALLVLPQPAAALSINPPGPIVQSVSANSVTIYWTTDVDADASVTVTPETGSPITRSISTLATGHTVIVDGLSSAMRYTYTTQSSDGVDTVTGVCAGACEFTTPSAAGDTEPPVLLNPFANTVCGAASCTTTISFRSNEGAKAEVTITTTGDVLSTPGFPTLFNSSFNGLTHATDYEYTIRLEDPSGNWHLYGPFTFTTCSVGTLICFSVGQCSDGTPLNTCNLDGEYCNGGVLELNCTRCGFECQVGATCKSGGACINDPLITDNTYQCNPSNCYDVNHEFISPAGAGCYKSWPECNSNVVLKVRNDRVCKRWIDCKSAIEVTDPVSKTVQQLCTSLGNCAQIDLATGSCSRFLPEGQCEDNPGRACSSDSQCETYNEGTCVLPSDPAYPLELAYTQESDLTDIRYLTGSIKPGFIWKTGENINGQYPWALAQQSGSSVNAISNNEFENVKETYGYDEQGLPVTKKEYTADPWFAVGGILGGTEVSKDLDGNITKVIVDRETPQDLNNPNHTLWVYPNSNEYAGARAPISGFYGTTAEHYRISMKIKATSIERQTVVLQLLNPDQLNPALRYPASARRVVALTTGWQTVNMDATSVSGRTFLQVVNVKGGSCANSGYACLDNNDCDTLTAEVCNPPTGSGLSANPFLIDDIYIQPVLLAGKDDTSYVARSCRLYPRGDSLSCAYEDQNGLQYQGWSGYCLERDPGNPSACVSWWPVDVIGSDTAVLGSFGGEVTSGYADRSPLYVCLEASGNAYRAADLDIKQCSSTKELCINDTDCDAIAVPGYCKPLSNTCFGTFPAVPCVTDLDCAITSLPQTCASVAGTQWWNSKPYIIGYPHGDWGADPESFESPIHDSCDSWPSTGGHTLAACNRAEQRRYDIPTTSPEYGLKEWEIDQVAADCKSGNCSENPSFSFTGNWQNQIITWFRTEHEFTRFVVQSDWKNPKSSAEPVTLHEGEIVWSFGPTGSKEAFGECPSDADCIQFNLIFDPEKGLVAYRVAHKDNKGDNEGGGYDVSFRLREYCKKVVQVVDDNGSSKAWTQRVARNSSYNVPGLNYGYTTDFAPFGALVQPAGTPESWDGDATLTGQQPLYVDAPQTNDQTLTSGAPYQSRAGSPYACKGNCSSKICESAGNKSGTFCATVNDCVGKDQSGATIVGRCVGVGTCQYTAQACVSNSDCPAIPGGTGQRELCIGGAASNKGGQAFSDSQASICKLSGKYCSRTATNMCFHTIAIIFNIEIDIPTGTVCTTNSDCVSGDTCKPTVSTGNEFCDDGGASGDICVSTATATDVNYAAYRIQRLFAESFGAWQWNAVSQRYDRLSSDVLWSPPSQICNARFCDDGSGKACTDDGQCASGTCRITTTPAVRPTTFNAAAPTLDYCGIPPRIFNVKVNNAADRTIIESDELVKFTFNSSADPNQLPLEAILVDWGDGEHQGLSFPYAPKSDADNPHVFLHAYTCTIDTPGYDATTNTCTFKPKALVRDNWGFCNNYWNDATHDTSLKCLDNFTTAPSTSWAPSEYATEPDGSPQREVIVTVNATAP